MKYIKLFANDGDAENFEWSNEYLEPYCSYTTQTNDVRYNKLYSWIEAHYTVSDGNYNTILCTINGSKNTRLDNLQKVVVDGEEIEFDLEDGYVAKQLTEGEHTAIFYFSDDEIEFPIFQNCTTLTSASFHNVRRVYHNEGNLGSSATYNVTPFLNCGALVDVNFDSSLKEICPNLIYGCVSVNLTIESEDFSVTGMPSICAWLNGKTSDNYAYLIPRGTSNTPTVITLTPSILNKLVSERCDGSDFVDRYIQVICTDPNWDPLNDDRLNDR
jgi:hypothetical protein